MYNYISIEGNIGAGKTSLATRIAEQFNAKLILEQFDDNPFLPKFYAYPDKYAFPLELSFLAARYQQLKVELGTGDLFKAFTVSDYFIYKSLIFARQTIHDDELALFNRLFEIIISHLPAPDLLVYLYVDVERLMHNIRDRGRHYEQEIKPSYLEIIQQSYVDFIRQQPDMRILLVDANRIDFVNNHEHYQALLDLIFRSYDKGIHRITIE